MIIRSFYCWTTCPQGYGWILSFIVQYWIVFYVSVIGLCEDDAVRQERAIRHDGPYFDEGVPKNVTAQLGAHAYLPCKVYNLKDKSVSLWFF